MNTYYDLFGMLDNRTGTITNSGSTWSNNTFFVDMQQYANQKHADLANAYRQKADFMTVYQKQPVYQLPAQPLTPNPVTGIDWLNAELNPVLAKGRAACPR